MREKRILHVSSFYLHLGGMEYQINALTQGLSKNFIIHLAADVSNEFYERYIQTGGIHVQWKVGSKFDLGAIASFNKIINSIKPDIVHIHDPRAGWLLRPLLLLRRIPVLYTTHAPPYFYIWQNRFSRLRQIFNGRIEQLLNLFFTSAVIYVSNNAYTHALDNHFVSPAKARLILNGINLDPYRTLSMADVQRLRRQANVSPDTPIICSIARLSAEKNLSFLLKAISQLHNEGYNFVVWIIGAGPEQSLLTQLVKELELETLVKFWGGQTNIPLFLSASNIFVLTSLFEGGRTISVMEAQAAGKPCVVSAAGDHSALVENNVTGFVFENGNQNAFANRIKLLLDSPEFLKQFGEAARRKAFTEYDIQTALSKHEELYNSIFK